MKNAKSLNLPGLLNSFGDIIETDWQRMRQPYIAIFYLDMQSDLYREHGMRFLAKLYDGPFYTGYHRVAERVAEIFDDIENNYPALSKAPPGAENSEQLLCVYL